ncbi:MAG: sec-independent protein translocase protein TatA [Solirubrobacteraceae bacterium]|jgi:sec-independent protein translocase protein TatA|nr:sec-independent protein translocase protein TatA [Solirubrobacteraceae bacterium]MEA2279080.1 sec-independent protein translocase protein TatA [Solirubrobacteraceae bacterium]MEA2358317.1 sec-independent protein translocase protein TatA [Solirubrobacteraceae bacterium]MEA2394957.1 sec-independent protein translocase protein TatA [Solirubrobacteraceae bacterium]
MLSGLESPMHLLVILAIALIVLGPKRLPEAGRGLGAAIRNFRESIASSHHDEEPPPPAVESSERPDL